MRWFSGLKVLFGLPLILAAATAKESSKPNILFLFTDDQDIELGSLNFLNVTRERILDQGRRQLLYITLVSQLRREK
jgi:hypothetical protein